MKHKFNISFLLTLIALMSFASKSEAQVSATATVTLTVIPAPGIDFTTAKSNSNSMIVTSNLSPSNPGITLRSSSNVLVQLNSYMSGENSQINFRQGDVKTLTARDLRSIKSVEIVYLGS